MLRHAAALAAAILVCGTSSAGSQGWEIGAKSGINHTSITEGTEFTWNATPTSALFGKRSLVGPLSIQSELSFVKRNGVSNVGGSSLTLTADYVEIPVMLNARLFSAFGIAPYMTLGPTVAFRWRCRLQFLGGGLLTDDDCDVARSAQSNRVDFGLTAGAGIGWTIAGVTLSVESRVNAGLRSYVLPTDVRNARSAGWSMLGGLSVPLYRTRALPPVWMPPRLDRDLMESAPAAQAIPAGVPAVAAPPEIVVETAGRHVSLKADDVDVRDVLDAIAKLSGLQVIVSPQIHKRVSLVLFDVPGLDAVQAVAQVAGLGVISSATPGHPVFVVNPPGAP